MVRPNAVLVLLSVLALPAPAAAIVVHGLSHAQLGAATVGEAATTDGLALSIDNIGSSGQDGVAIDLASTDGLSIRFGSPPVLLAPIVMCDLELRRGGQTLTIVGSSFRTMGATGGIEVGMSVPGATEMEVEIWDGPKLVLSTTVPSSSHVIRDVQAGEVCDDGDRMDLSMERSQDDGVLESHLEAVHVFPSSAPTTVGGVTFAGNRYVLRAGIPLGTEPNVEGRLTAGSGGGGGGSGGSIYLMTESLIFDPHVKRGPPRPSAGTITGESGVVLTRGSSPHIVDLVSDATDDPPAVRISNVNRPNISFDPRGANTTMRVSFLPQPDPAPGTSVSTTLSSIVTWDPNTGGPLQDVTHSVTWSSSSPGFWQHDVFSDDPFIAHVLRVRRGGGLVLHESPGVTYATSKPPIRHTVDGQTNTPGCTALLSYPGGTVITISGQTFEADEVQMVYSHGTGGTFRRIPDIRIVHPPSSPPGSMARITNVECVPVTQAVHGGGRGFFGRGPRQSTSLEGSYYRVDNIGSSGQDGIEIPFHGVPSADFAFHGGTPPLVDGAPPVVLGFSTYPCDDGSCPPSSEMRVTNSHAVGEAIALSIISSSLGRLWMQVNGDIYPFHVADLDGDGAADLAPASSSPAPVARIRYQEYPDDVASSQRWEVHFHEAVTVQTPSGPAMTNAVTVHRDVLKTYFETGDIPTEDQFARLWGLPPGEPVGDFHGVCTLVLEEPGLSTSACGAPGTPITIHGESFKSTFSKLTGATTPKDPPDDDCDGITVSPGDFFDASSPPTMTTVSNTPGDRGKLLTFDLPSVGLEPEQTQVLLRTRSKATGKQNQRVLISTGGGSSSIELLPIQGGWITNTCTIRSSGIVTSSTSATMVAFSSPPRAVAIGDLDLDGDPDVRVMGFPPGTTATVGGATVACDEVLMEQTLDQPVPDTDECAMSFVSMPYAIDDVRMANLANPADVVAVDPVMAPGARFALSAPAPNPSSEFSTLRLALRESAHVRARVIDLAGREVARIADARFEPGEHALRWDGRTKSGALAPAGLYFVRVERVGGEATFARITRLR